VAQFKLVVGKRRTPLAGAPPSKAARSAMESMARYRTRVPKGVIVYASHEDANRDWGAVAARSHGAAPAQMTEFPRPATWELLSLRGLFLTKEGMREKDRADAVVLRKAIGE
jgi:hypothetical protein